MSQSFTAYPDYRRPAHPWIKQVPFHWDERRAKVFFREIDDRSVTGKEELLSVSHLTGVTPRSQKNVTMFKAESYVGHKRSEPGDIVINTMWAWMAALGVSRHLGLVSPAYGVYRTHTPEIYNPFFVDYLVRSEAYVAEYNCRSTGIQSSRLRLYPAQFLDIPFIRPPREEQDQIVVYLRAQDAKIARFIRDKRRLIELLNEQKQTLIHRAVTRGLDPYVRLKSSGMEWLGEVPEHWSVIPLKAAAVVAFSGVDKLTEEGESPVLLCNYTDVYRNDQIMSNLMFMKATATPHEIARFTLRKGDVLMTKDSETPDDIGVPAWVSEELHGVVCGYHLALLRPRPAVAVGAFLYRALCSPHVASQFHVAAAGVTRFGLAKRDIQTAVLAVPPVAEQVNIVKWLERETVELDKVISGAKAEIDLMREYRDRLIADVVTGQIDVRSWVPGPDDQIDDSEVTLEIEAEEAMDEQGDNNDDDGHE
jgi:type I restriction enzyme, S subunit